ncbi:DUF4352 domain-containing protein [Streptomyces caeni]|uniref:DUF4352 domain-containing protein n=1 Tax=Streptomyces caeni TaxID=2307231 RepID=A0ABW4IL98_9ACTN
MSRCAAADAVRIAESREPRAGSREPRAGSREPGADRAAEPGPCAAAVPDAGGRRDERDARPRPGAAARPGAVGRTGGRAGVRKGRRQVPVGVAHATAAGGPGAPHRTPRRRHGTGGAAARRPAARLPAAQRRRPCGRPDPAERQRQRLDVTVVKAADPAKSSDEFTAPESGKRFVGVQFKLVNTGTAAYGDSPGNGAQIIDAEGQQFESTFADITADPSMSSDVKLKPGTKALGWIVFEVPKGSKAATVQFTMDSGMTDQTGEWKLF